MSWSVSGQWTFVFAIALAACSSDDDDTGGAGSPGSGGGGAGGSAGRAGSSGASGASGASGTSGAGGSGGGGSGCAAHGKIGEDCLNDSQCGAGLSCLAEPGICLPQSALGVGCSLQACPGGAQCVSFTGISFRACLTAEQLSCACQTPNGKADITNCM
jgi:hypothetical protein